ncbi:MAG: DNA-protecting protein DprA [Oscillospiraceae bacterium]|jgi:DNA processing protein|nr:DNA-protecting protein DprA [Oscillospiraceae bacterium]
MKEYYIWLLSVMGAANPRSLRLISRFGGVKGVYDALTAGEDGTGFLKPAEEKALKKSSPDKARELIEWCGKKGYGITTIEDEDYPELLRHIYNPPILLFTEGSLSGIDGEIRINVIGTRSPSEYSYKVASALCASLAATGIVIVSGMAVGLDKCAMTAALAGGGKVAGVLACGIDAEYPRGSKAFRKSVVEAGGVCVSELMPRDAVRPAYFQNRNRLMSGLSSGTLIIEAGERSGCHITAAHAVAQNRDLFCVPPHDILDPRYSGVVRYLRDGAIPAFGYIDIINEYLPDLSDKLNDSAVPRDLRKPGAAVAGGTPAEPAEQSKMSVKPPAPQSAPKADYSALPEERLKIVEALRKKKLSFDEIVRKKLCAADKAYETLLDMELDGIIERVAGDRYAAV